MRIAFVVGEFPALSETFILDQMTGLIDRGHDVTIFARPPGDPTARLHATVNDYRLTERVHLWDRVHGPREDAVALTGVLLRSHPLRTLGEMGRALASFRPGDNLIRLWSRATLLQSVPAPDLLFAQFGPNGVLAEQARRICGLHVPIAVTFLGHDLSRLLKTRSPSYYRNLFARGELMLPLSEYFRDRLVAIGCPPEKIQVQRLGVDAGKFRFRARALQRGEPIRVASVARLVEKKGLETGLRAFARLGPEFPAMRWDIIGDGPLRPGLEALRNELRLGDTVSFRGAMPREQVRELLEASHLLLAPSVTAADGDQEGTPVAIMEAMAVGMPVVSTWHSGIPELVADGRTGLLVPERDDAALAAALAQLARHPEQWGDMGRLGRVVVERDYDTRVLGDRLEQMLRALVERRV